METQTSFFKTALSRKTLQHTTSNLEVDGLQQQQKTILDSSFVSQE